MTWDDFWWLRIINMLTCIVCVTLLGYYLWSQREITPRRYRRIGWAFWLILVAVSYGSGRAASLGAPIAEHTAFAVVSSTILVTALLWHPEGDDRVPPDDGSIYERAKKAYRYYQYHRRESNG